MNDKVVVSTEFPYYSDDDCDHDDICYHLLNGDSLLACSTFLTRTEPSLKVIIFPPGLEQALKSLESGKAPTHSPPSEQARLPTM